MSLLLQLAWLAVNIDPDERLLAPAFIDFVIRLAAKLFDLIDE